MAAKKTSVSSATITFSVAGPPGRAANASATSATIAKLRAALIATQIIQGSLRDRAAGGEPDHDRAERHPVDHERRERVTREIAQQERDRPVADDEGEHRGHQQLTAAGVGLVATEELAQLEQRAQH